jgi:hypothetical protein
LQRHGDGDDGWRELADELRDLEMEAALSAWS